MTYLETWKKQLKDDLATFAPLAKEVLPHQYEFGVIAGAILWDLRHSKSQQLQALDTIMTDPAQANQLKLAINEWDIKEPIYIVRKLLKRQEKDDALRPALLALMTNFLDILLETGSLRERPQEKLRVGTINVNAPVTGENIVIGGVQYIAGNQIIQHIRQILSACPDAPEPPKHFVKRPNEFEQLIDKLINSDNQAVAVTAVHGMGGIGKTTLIQGFCHQDDKPFDMVLWAKVTPNPDVTKHLTQWARYAIDDYQLPTDQPLDVVASVIRSYLTDRLLKGKCGKHCLVVFDDVWNNGKDAVKLLTLAAPENAKILITTRHEQVAYDLKSHVMSLGRLNDNEAMAMCRNLCDPKKHHLTEDHLKRLIKVVKGHPLTLELAMAALNGTEDGKHADRLLDKYESGLKADSPLDAVKFYIEDAPPELTIVFESSYTALSDEAQRAFRELGILASESSWIRPTAGAIWDIDNEAHVTDLHQQLRQHAFIQQNVHSTEQYGITFYQQHPLLRSYARALLNDGEMETTFSKYTYHITHIASNFRELPKEQWYILDPFLPHIDYVGDELTRKWEANISRSDRLQKQISDFVWQIMHYIYNRPSAIRNSNMITLRGVSWLNTGLEVYQLQDDKPLEAILSNIIGLVWRNFGATEKALVYYHRALKVALEEDDTAANIHNNIGLALYDLGKTDEALTSYTIALHEIDDELGKATILNNIGNIWYSLGKHPKAMKYYEDAFDIREKHGDKQGKGISLACIGTVYQSLGDIEKSVSMFELALEFVQEVGDEIGEGNTLNQLGKTLQITGDLNAAIRMYEQAKEIFFRTGSRVLQATMHNNIGSVYRLIGENDKAEEQYNQAWTIQLELDDKVGQAITLNNLGVLQAAMGDNALAINYYKRALDLTNDNSLKALSLNNIAASQHNLGETRSALEIYAKCLAIQRKLNDIRSEAVTLTNMGIIYRENGDPKNAIKYYKEALAKQRRVQDKVEEARTLNNFGLAWSDSDENKKAFEAYDSALTLQRQTMHKAGEATTLNNMGLAFERQGKITEALNYYNQALLIQKDVEDKLGQAVTHYNIGNIYGVLEKWSKAISHMEKSAQLHKEIKHPDLPDVRKLLMHLRHMRSTSRLR